MSGGEIVRCRIHPRIGAARVGNSPLTTFANNDAWYDTIAGGPVTVQVHNQGNSLWIEQIACSANAPSFKQGAAGFVAGAREYCTGTTSAIDGLIFP